MDFKRIFASTVGALAILWGACSFSVESGQRAGKAAIEAPDMDAFWAAHAAHRQSGDLESATGILAEDCVLFEPFQPPLSGRQTIAAKMRQAQDMAEVHEVSLDSQEVYHHDGWLVDFGNFSETVSFKGKDGRHVFEGSYAAVLERDADGDWKVERFMALPSTPPPRLDGEEASAAAGD